MPHIYCERPRNLAPGPAFPGPTSLGPAFLSLRPSPPTLPALPDLPAPLVPPNNKRVYADLYQKSLKPGSNGPTYTC